MKGWQKGAVLGFMWSLLVLFIDDWKYTEFLSEERFRPLGIIIAFPFFVARKLGFYYESIFIGGPLIGIIIGSVLGYVYDSRKEDKKISEFNLKLNYQQKGALYGAIYGGVGAIAKEASIQNIPLIKYLWILFLPLLPVVFFSGESLFFFFAPLFGYIIGVFVGKLYGRWKEK